MNSPGCRRAGWPRRSCSARRDAAPACTGSGKARPSISSSRGLLKNSARLPLLIGQHQTQILVKLWPDPHNRLRFRVARASPEPQSPSPPAADQRSSADDAGINFLRLISVACLAARIASELCDHLQRQRRHRSQLITGRESRIRFVQSLTFSKNARSRSPHHRAYNRECLQREVRAANEAPYFFRLSVTLPPGADASVGGWTVLAGVEAGMLARADIDGLVNGDTPSKQPARLQGTAVLYEPGNEGGQGRAPA